VIEKEVVEDAMSEMNFSQMQSQMMTLANPAALSRVLVGKYQKAQTRGWFNRWVSRLLGRSSQILSLEAAIKDHPVTASHYSGLHSVPLEQIQGSEARTEDFDRSFNPLTPRSMARWLNVARARLTGVPLPPVELIEVNGKFFVRDGHHRVSVAHALGENYIEADVTVWEVVSQIEQSRPLGPAIK
jgi:hypothetical protein